ncbi:MAG TPA: extracellular solute-binding protein [Candidatus Eisenbergiella merdipullorum]|uniref:Extracellular solute-binding protein n=1 Tax=Candidatus Eisenbergiella merdipullorum TaxID=2838553 RepID=A0A9D2I496_9FIRM|nr:extracellular solute-binding protein [Candidatus Eisenbergiella merdipullorum]
MKKKKVSAMLLAAMVAASALAGCGSGQTAQTNESTAQQEASVSEEPSQSEEASETAASESQEAGGEVVYPLKTDETLVYWGELNANVAANFSSLGETEYGKQWQEQTGVTIEFQHPASGQTNEQFNLMIADGTYPDLWEYNWKNYPGGPGKAIDEGIILDLTDLINEYCPALRAYLDENPDIDKEIQTEDGRYYSFPMIREVEAMCTSRGPMIRKDWLEECGLEVPETVEEWHTVLTAFKDQMGATAPYTPSHGLIWSYAYGVGDEFRLEGDQVIYTAATEDYKEYLKTMAAWWEEGLLDKDMFSGGDDLTSVKMTNGASGATYMWVASGLQNVTLAAREEDPDYTLIATKWPVLNKGEKPEYGYMESRYSYGGIAIGASCKDPVLAAQVLDYEYTEAGSLLANFGVEGVSYTMVDGKPTMTEEVTNNPDGWNITQAWCKYAIAPANGAFIQSWDYQTQILQIDEAREALSTWADTNAKEHLLPTLYIADEDNDEYVSIMNEVQTYVSEMNAKFIMGTEDVETGFDEYLNTLESMGLERAVEMRQAAYDRYLSR